MSVDRDGLLANLISPFAINENGVNWKLADAFAEGLYAPFVSFFAQCRIQMFLKTATGTFLDDFGYAWGEGRLEAEGDESYRARIALRILRKWGGVTINELLTLAAAILDTVPSNLPYEENENESGVYEGLVVLFDIDTAIPLANGIAAVDLPDFLDNVRGALDEAAGAGVRIILRTEGSGIWDAGVWDSDTWS